MSERKIWANSIRFKREYYAPEHGRTVSKDLIADIIVLTVAH